MRTLFKRANPEIDAYLQREERARAWRLEAFAIEALQLGLAFEEQPAQPSPQTADSETPADLSKAAQD